MGLLIGTWTSNAEIAAAWEVLARENIVLRETLKQNVLRRIDELLPLTPPNNRIFERPVTPEGIPEDFPILEQACIEIFTREKERMVAEQGGIFKYERGSFEEAMKNDSDMKKIIDFFDKYRDPTTFWIFWRLPISDWEWDRCTWSFISRIEQEDIREVISMMRQRFVEILFVESENFTKKHDGKYDHDKFIETLEADPEMKPLIDFFNKNCSFASNVFAMLLKRRGDDKNPPIDEWGDIPLEKVMFSSCIPLDQVGWDRLA